MHAVNIDEAAIEAGFNEYAVEGEFIPRGAAGPEQPAPEEKPWLAPARMVASIIANGVAPNWEIPADIREDWADALADCADDLMPGGLANIANWGPWARLAFSSGALLMCGIDYEDMKFKPLKAGAAEPEEPEGAYQRAHTGGGAFTSGEPGTS